MLSLLIKILVVFVAGVLVYTAMPFFIKQEGNLEKKILRLSRVIQEEDFRFNPPTQKDYSAFLAEFGQRDIFAYPQISEAAVPAAGIDWQKVNKIVENLRLVGIISMEPKKAIIEDKSAGRTFYLKEEEEFLENTRLKKIMKGSVTIDCCGKSFELYL